MAMNLVQQGEDLQDFSDEALANELQTGQRGYLPVAVLSEIERRTRDRQRYQQTMAAQQAEAPPVVEARLMEFMAQAQPSPEMGMAPEMPPEMAAMSPQGIMAAQPEMASMPAEAPAGIASMMPVQQAAEGGTVRRAQTGMTSIDPLGYLVGEGMTLTGRGISGAAQGIASMGMTAPGYASIMSRSPSSEVERLRRQIASRRSIGLDTSQQEAQLRSLLSEGQEQAAPASQSASIFDRKPGTDYSGGTQESAPRPSVGSFTPSISNFQDVYNRELADRLLKGVTVQSQRVTPESVAAASEKARTGFYPQEFERLRKFAPDKEKFDKSRQSDLLVGLGSVIAGATQRGDIAKGLAQLAAQQREAQKEFRREEREYMGLESALRREQRAEERADVREREAVRRADEAIERAAEQGARSEAFQIAQQTIAGEKDMITLQQNRQLMQLKMEEAKREIAAAVSKQQKDIAEFKLKNLETMLKMLNFRIETLSDPSKKAVFESMGGSGGVTSLLELQSLGQ